MIVTAIIIAVVIAILIAGSRAEKREKRRSASIINEMRAEREYLHQSVIDVMREDKNIKHSYSVLHKHIIDHYKSRCSINESENKILYMPLQDIRYKRQYAIQIQCIDNVTILSSVNLSTEEVVKLPYKTPTIPTKDQQNGMFLELITNLLP